MATTALTVNSPSREAQADIMEAAAADGNHFDNTGKELLLVTNDSGASVNVTIAIDATIDGEDPGDKVIAVPAGATVLLGPFPKGWYSNDDGQVVVTYSDETSVSVSVLKP